LYFSRTDIGSAIFHVINTNFVGSLLIKGAAVSWRFKSQTGVA